MIKGNFFKVKSTSSAKSELVEEQSEVVWGPILPPDAREPFEVFATVEQGVDRLPIGKALVKALMRAGLQTIGDARDYTGAWTDLPGVGAKGAETIKSALDAYRDAPKEATQETVIVAPQAQAVADDARPQAPRMVVVERSLALIAPRSVKVLEAAFFFDGADALAVAEGMRMILTHEKTLVLFDSSAPYAAQLREWCVERGVMCVG